MDEKQRDKHVELVLFYTKKYGLSYLEFADDIRDKIREDLGDNFESFVYNRFITLKQFEIIHRNDKINNILK